MIFFGKNIFLLHQNKNSDTKFHIAVFVSSKEGITRAPFSILVANAINWKESIRA